MLLAISFFAYAFAFGYCQSGEQLLEDISKYISESDAFVLPRDNSASYETTDASLCEYGTFDFIIVGGGATGCVLANRLSEITGWKILLIEAGGSSDDVTEIPGMLIYSFTSPYNWGYNSTEQTTCCQGMVNKQCAFPKGKGLGGSSLVNALIYLRGNPGDYDQWAKLGNPGWSYGDVLPYFKKSEHIDIPDADRKYHGTDGLLHINYTSPGSVVNSTCYQAATLDMNLRVIDPNAEQQIGYFKVQSAVNFNKGQQAGKVFIAPIKDRSNLNITLNAFAVKIITSEDRAVGVEFIKDRKRYIARANLEVIVTSGAINSAQLLMLSGIGPRKHLEEIGINVLKDLPVGKNLVDHPVFFGLFFSTNLSAQATTLPEQLAAYLNGQTPLTRTFGEEAGFWYNPQGGTRPDLEFLTFTPPRGGNMQRLFNFNDQNTAASNALNPNTTIQLLVALLHPKSRGSVKLKSNSALDFPLIDLHFLSDSGDEDIENLYKGIQYALEFFNGTQFRNVDTHIPFLVPDCEPQDVLSKEYWYCALRQLTTTYYHPVGTTKMGSRSKCSVVDHNLVVHGFKNLRVGGEGIFPTATAAHKYAPCLMIGEKLGDIIKIQYGVL